MTAAYEYTIPTPDGDRTVMMVEPTIDLVLAAEKMREADPLHLLRNCIVEIDGEAVTSQQLRGKGLGERLPCRVVQALTLMLADLTMPSKEDIKVAKGSKRAVAR